MKKMRMNHLPTQRQEVFFHKWDGKITYITGLIPIGRKIAHIGAHKQVSQTINAKEIPKTPSQWIKYQYTNRQEIQIA